MFFRDFNLDLLYGVLFLFHFNVFSSKILDYRITIPKLEMRVCIFLI